MPIICPAITAYSEDEYKVQIEKVVHFCQCIHIDLTDGVFTKEKTITPEQAWWPVGFKASFHLMYKNPAVAIKTILQHQPNLIIMHAEAEGNFQEMADLCHQHQVRVGLALLESTPAEKILPALNYVEHVLIFSGNLGYQGNSRVNLSLLEKVKLLKQHKPELEIGWDGGVSDQNVAELINGGVDILDVGGFIQRSDDPARSLNMLQRIADETGTT